MTVRIPGYSTVTGKPETILNLLKDSQVFTVPDNASGNAESMLRSMADARLIIIEEEVKK